MKVNFLPLYVFLISLAGCMTTHSNNKVYVYVNKYKPAFVLDVVDNHAGIGSSGYFLKDCSSNEVNCIESPIFNFAIPKSSKLPKTWTFNGINYVVDHVLESNEDKIFVVLLEVNSDINRLVLDNINTIYYSKKNGIIRLGIGHYDSGQNKIEFFDYELRGKAGFQFKE
ncbi:hypothetical protein GCM10023151_03950 [Kangiella marina]|uniref:Lipoprotein n=2 Tax=Kangiella marina TaxID=1079178 RepID=A0ABP8ID53_9GAMM